MQPKAYATAFCVIAIVAAIAGAEKPCNWRCNAPECMCFWTPDAVKSQCICAGEKGLGERCYDDLQCSDGNKCTAGVCTYAPRETVKPVIWTGDDEEQMMR